MKILKDIIHIISTWYNSIDTDNINISEDSCDTNDFDYSNCTDKNSNVYRYYMYNKLKR